MKSKYWGYPKSLPPGPVRATGSSRIELCAGSETERVLAKKGEPSYNALVNLLTQSSYPLNVKKILGSVTLKRTDSPKRVVVLDTNGYVTGKAETSTTKNAVTITLPQNALYTVVEY